MKLGRTRPYRGSGLGDRSERIIGEAEDQITKTSPVSYLDTILGI